VKIYLAGRVDTPWRWNFGKECFGDAPRGIELIDPSAVEKRLWGRVVDHAAGFNPVGLNLNLLDKSDLVVAVFWPAGHIPIGTSAEVFYAWQKSKPVIALVPQSLRKHPWLHQMATVVLELPFSAGLNPIFAAVTRDVREFVGALFEQLYGRTLESGPPPRKEE